VPVRLTVDRVNHTTSRKCHTDVYFRRVEIGIIPSAEFEPEKLNAPKDALVFDHIADVTFSTALPLSDVLDRSDQSVKVREGMQAGNENRGPSAWLYMAGAICVFGILAATGAVVIRAVGRRDKSGNGYSGSHSNVPRTPR
jgi:hypothetical protein